MKVVIFENNYHGSEASGKPSWYVTADSALSNTGKPFYLPEAEGDVTVWLGMAVKINRLGKYIMPKFAGRYFSEVAPAVCFQLTDLKHSLLQQGLLPSPALSFDRAVMAADFVPAQMPFENLSLQLLKNAEPVAEWKAGSMVMSIADTIHEFSKTNTLKMGDLFLPSITGNIKIEEGDYLEVTDGKRPLFHVKVK